MIALLLPFFIAQGAVPGARSFNVTKENQSTHFRVRVAVSGLVTMHFSESVQPKSAELTNREGFSVTESSAEQLNVAAKKCHAGDRATLAVSMKAGLRLFFDLLCVERAEDADAFIDVEIDVR